MRTVRSGLSAAEHQHLAVKASCKHALNMIGFHGCVSVCMSWPCVEHEALDKASMALLAMHPKLPVNWRVCASEGSLLLVPMQLTLKSAPGWRVAPTAQAVASNGGVLKGACFAVTCPAKCGSVIQLPTKPATQGRQWPIFRCGS